MFFEISYGYRRRKVETDYDLSFAERAFAFFRSDEAIAWHMPKVEYSLTELGKTTLPFILDMAKWGKGLVI